MEIRKVSQSSHDTFGAPGDEAHTQAYLDQVKAAIRDNGWVRQAVPASLGNGRFDYVYTIGLVERKCTAELLIAGLPYQQGAEILNQIAGSMVNGLQMIPPDEWPLA